LARISGVPRGAHFASCEVEDAGFVALRVGFQERAPTGEFDVVGMGGNSEKVEGHEGSRIAGIYWHAVGN